MLIQGKEYQLGKKVENVFYHDESHMHEICEKNMQEVLRLEAEIYAQQQADKPTLTDQLSRILNSKKET